ncbi:unnamed protein product [Blepharisma stoltei]|uniref:Uncharacterized protein n=1 Tax=Blepharisma stoltei TaxID=1481888 RepID=A0AAU9IFE2_9CILI|nr:unnamed protein product [Blepharisma stoltei]
MKIFLLILTLVNSLERYTSKIDIRESENISCEELGCDYCCLATNVCGSEEACEQRKYPLMIINLFYITSVLFCTGMVLWHVLNRGKGINTKD